ncbi:MAG TPA: tRNA epoxyqueuosine(34) reductase QueG [Anaerolineae bacterium]|nr:tRNA epoxyqueuosine(34) reductase QueG [Anaerolineae bacterium]
MPQDLKQIIQGKARQLGFILTGVTLPTPPPHYSTYENWLAQGHHGSMKYLETERSRARRSNPREILPECKSILVLATPYDPPTSALPNEHRTDLSGAKAIAKAQTMWDEGRVASYAHGADYHDILPARMKELVQFIEEQVGGPVKNRYYTDTGPILERDLAQRAGIGWIGKNTCLINPKQGSYFFISEILLDLELDPDPPFVTDHCGTCTRCIEACPTDCILPDRTLDATRCISYLTIELKDDIPVDLRDKLGNWTFGCDICQEVCPWNRFAPEGDTAFVSTRPPQMLTEELSLTPQAFNQRFKSSPVKRAKRRGYLRNVAVALGNSSDTHHLPVLKNALKDDEPMIREHAQWAIDKITKDTPR